MTFFLRLFISVVFKQDKCRLKNMLCYLINGINQDIEAEVYRRLNEENIPLWMDIYGGTKGHISER